jgi:hypothetical protein
MKLQLMVPAKLFTALTNHSAAVPRFGSRLSPASRYWTGHLLDQRRRSLEPASWHPDGEDLHRALEMARGSGPKLQAASGKRQASGGKLDPAKLS